ncbi:Coenzyme F420 hydrogenase/dehydrogenase, beta subunit C-terminal domain [Chloroflexota bacterium]
MNSTGFNKLQEDVIEAGLCTACGTCVGVCPKNSLEFDFALEEPVLTGECKPCGICYAICPGKDIPLPELDRMLFSRERRVDKELLGICSRWQKGYATDPEVRQSAASGGCTSALLIYALEKGLIDGAIVVGMNLQYPWRTEPRLVTTRDEVLAAAQSKYALVPSNILINEAEHRGLNRLAIVGLPCHIHGIRKMQMYGKPKKLISRIKFIIGLFCGTNRSYRATELSIAMGAGIPLESIAKLEYRGGPESQDRIITTRDGKTFIVPKKVVFESMAQIRRYRCEWCWDFSAELADISVGDIFLPVENIRLPKVTSVITRTESGALLIDGAKKRGYIDTTPLAESGFSFNIGLSSKKRNAARNLIKRKVDGLPAPDYHYELKHEPPVLSDVKAAVLKQMTDIPEIVEWVERTPWLKEKLSAIDVEILQVMGQ